MCERERDLLDAVGREEQRRQLRVFVKESERERERESVCVRVCVCVRERPLGCSWTRGAATSAA